MKRIYLIRHGKAEEGLDKADFERNLIDKGERKTRKMAAFMSDQKIKVDLMLVSMSNRTKQTAQILADEFSVSPGKIKIEKTLYLASTNSILDVIFGVDNQVENLVVVGHNPGISSLAVYLSKKEDLDWMPTSAVTAIEFKTNKWEDIPNAKCKIMFYKKPADL